MASCDKTIGIRNIILTFLDCDGNIIQGPLVHEPTEDSEPNIKTCKETREALSSGRSKIIRGNTEINDLSVYRRLEVPLSLYQGCAAVNVTLEYYNGLVYTGLNGTVVGAEGSDGTIVNMSMIFEDIDELNVNAA
jgi:hypothetical protein